MCVEGVAFSKHKNNHVFSSDAFWIEDDDCRLFFFFENERPQKCQIEPNDDDESAAATTKTTRHRLEQSSYVIDDGKIFPGVEIENRR